MINNSKINLYIKNKKYVGSFWALCLVGIRNIMDIKYLIIETIINLIIQIVLSYYTNIIIIEKISLPKNILMILLIIYSAKILFVINKWLFYRIILSERLSISKRIGNYVNNLYINAPYTWKSKNSNLSQKDSLSQILFTYNELIFSISQIIQLITRSIIMILVAFQNNLVIGFVIIASSIFIFMVKKGLIFLLSDFDDNIRESENTKHLITNNRFTNRSDISYIPKLEKLFSENNCDPINSLGQICKIEDQRYVIYNQINMIISILQSLVVGIMCVYLLMFSSYHLIFFMVVNGNSLFGFVDVITQMEQIKNIIGRRLSDSFTMLDDLCELISSKPEIKHYKIKRRINNLSIITINNINKHITENMKLEYNGVITIKPYQKGIILLKGKKGCGKSVTLDILAGLYDDYVSDGIYVDDKKMRNEFRDIIPYRTYIRQCVTDNYKSNNKNTIIMTLNELFPGGSLNEINSFLTDFELLHKIPQELDIPISSNEKNFSPGEIQLIVLASQFWKAYEINAPLLLLDEPDSHVDIETIKNIFDKILQKFNGTIILVSRSPEFEHYLQKFIKEVWSYDSNIGTKINFSINKL